MIFPLLRQDSFRPMLQSVSVQKRKGPQTLKKHTRKQRRICVFLEAFRLHLNNRNGFNHLNETEKA